MFRHALIFIMLLTLMGCGFSAGGRGVSTGAYDTLYHNSYAARFELLGSGDTVIVRVKNPWQGAQDKVFDYRVDKPFRRVVCMSSSHVAILDALSEATERVVGVSGLRFLTTKAVSSAKDIGYDNNINYEMLVALRPDMIFVYEVSGENSATVQKMQQLGLPVMYIADYLESSPLGRAEWLVAFGAMVGRLEEAQKLFEHIKIDYLMIRDSVAKTVARGAEKPKIMLNSPYRDVWYVPGDKSYIVQLIGDAGGEYLASGQDDDVSRPISVEVAYELMQRADVWMNPSIGAQSLAQVKALNGRFSDLEVVRKGLVYNNNLRSTEAGGSDFWESGSIRPDVVLRDMVKIFHPSLMQGYEFYYFQKLK